MEAAALKMIEHVLLVLETDDNQKHRCLKRECHVLDCSEDDFLLSKSVIVERQSDFWAALRAFQSKQPLSQFRVVAPFLWCQKLYSWSETTRSAVWT